MSSLNLDFVGQTRDRSWPGLLWPLVLVAILWGIAAPRADAQASATGGGPATATAPPATRSVETPEPAAGDHSDPTSPLLLGLIVIILAARVGGHLFEVVGQPPVLGELVVGVILGNLSLAGIHALEFLKVDYSGTTAVDLVNHLRFAGITIEQLARIGIIMLLFQVGLEANLADFRKVGLSAFLVAVLGVIAPMALGWGAGAMLLPERGWPVHMFLGATLCATSVGITARVLLDLGKSKTKEAQIVLGAAVIDDVLGLMVLSVVQGIIVAMSLPATQPGAGFGMVNLLVICVKAFGFLFGALFLGQFVSRSVFKAASYLHGSGMLTVTALAICFFFSWLASQVGLAPIVGAFAAGLILEKVQYRELAERQRRELDELMRPLADLLVPIFFVMMGIQVDLRSFADPKVLGLAAVLFLVAVVGKQVCALGVLESGLNRLSIGVGMIPRGEVGLIFAAVGRQLYIGGQRAVDDGIYSALVLMVIATTLVTPPLLKLCLDRTGPGVRQTHRLVTTQPTAPHQVP